MSATATVDQIRLLSSFESVRKTLLSERFADRLDKPLAYWALPDDRRLPIAFLDRTLSDILSTPFQQLAATPGVGQKKICSLVQLLQRATADEPPMVPFGSNLFQIPVQTSHVGGNGHANGTEHPRASSTAHESEAFNPALVSEVLWSRWCDAVRKHEVRYERLGRLAPTLQELPTVIWNTPLTFYLDLPVSKIRQLKTHGEKRVRAVLQVFYVVNELLASTVERGRLAVRLIPKMVSSVEGWIADVRSRDVVVKPNELRENLVSPLLEQIQIDGGETLHHVLRSRLGVDCPQVSVRALSKELGVTRARVYQLIDDCGAILNVRWPEGKEQLLLLYQRLEAAGASRQCLTAVNDLLELLYPSPDQRPG